MRVPHGRRLLPSWRVPGSSLGGRPPKCLLLVLLPASLLVSVLVGLGTSATAFGVSWASHAWQPTPTTALMPPHVAARVQPIIQADTNAGYDSPTQHDQWWDSVCSAATFTEVAHAWGMTTVTLGHVLDRLLAHTPPYITVSGGLMSQDGWAWMAAAYHLHAQVAWHALTFASLVAQVNRTGVPLIIGVRAAGWGHYVVVVGGDSTQARIVDSSLWRMRSLPRSFFTRPTAGIIDVPIWWSGETILLVPA